MTLRDANISNNQAGANGGGVSVFGAATVANTTLADNTAGGGQGGALNVVGLSNSLVMTNVQVLRNTSAYYGGGVYASDTVAVTGGVLENNTCTANGCTGGGLYANRLANVNAVRFSGNAATGSGGALYLVRGAERIVNTLLDGNSAPQGAGIYDAYGGTTILFTTVASPTVGTGSAIYLAAGTVAITDTVVASYTTGIAAGSGTLQGDYNLFYNAPTTLVTGTHSLTGDPRFRDPAAGNYRLVAASPAVGAGVNVSVTVDLDGAPRPQGSGFDLGAYQVNNVWYVDPAGDDGNTCFFPGAANACQTIGGALGKAQIGSTIYITDGRLPGTSDSDRTHPLCRHGRRRGRRGCGRQRQRARLRCHGHRRHLQRDDDPERRGRLRRGHPRQRQPEHDQRRRAHQHGHPGRRRHLCGQQR